MGSIMRISAGLLAAITMLAFATPSIADIQVIIISVDDVPYHLGPSAYENSPSNYANSATNYENSHSNYDNSVSNYDNSGSNYDNSSRRLIDPSGNVIGHYVLPQAGVLNFYGDSVRVAYMPSGGHTQSVFASTGDVWCGVIADVDGALILAITRSCYMRFLID